ncbi:hypothetical protein DSO57_1023619 [Entomophthora muscae]|uniref:Uncharacterized protein n=1 Tax=Entomophthora muscae TaxID=34485 RepID=A0ACC2UCS6_9FUNG|nr:hypothetical protein DSO57_1023619 [Entomophthora muscae]
MGMIDILGSRTLGIRGMCLLYFFVANLLLKFSGRSYCNSVLQALYFCKPFRECINNFPIRSPLITRTEAHLAEAMNDATISQEPNPSKVKRKSSTIILSSRGSSSSVPALSGKLPFNPDEFTTHQALNIPENLFTSLKDLFAKIECQSKRIGTIAPSSFINRLKQENEDFRGAQHQDAHEFLNFTLNRIAEHVVRMKKDEDKRERENGVDPSRADSSTDKDSEVSKDSNAKSTPVSWVQQIFEGKLTNETKCLTCDTVTCKEESFIDLSIDIEENSSVSSCLRQFSANEMLCDRNKYFCDVCNNLQEAEKRMRIKKLPNVLALHLKRFKFQERLNRFAKLPYRVVFPMDLRLFNTTNDSDDTDRLYSLFAIVVHIGSGLNHGHYVSVVKSGSHWLLFDDETVERIDEEDICKFFGDHPGVGSGYVLFYEAQDLNLESLGLVVPSNSPSSVDPPTLPSSPLSLESVNSTGRNPSRKKTLTPPSFFLNQAGPYSALSPPSTSSITNGSNSLPSAGWFSKSNKAPKSKPSEIKIPKHEFYPGSVDKDTTKPSSMVMTAWR